jgi:hypothetical protein
VSGINTEAVEEAGRVVGHFLEVVAAGGEIAGESGRQVRKGPTPCLARQSDVAIVEPDDEKPLAGQQLAKGFVPRDLLHAEAHDEQDAGVAGGAEGVVVELYPVGRQLSHGPIFPVLDRTVKLNGGESGRRNGAGPTPCA